MSTFIETCRCNGRQPSGVVGRKRVARPEAVGLLLKDRGVPRFLVAPDGYGKTHAIFEYASIIFAFKHVMWVRCTSPCFVRDLDAGSLREGIDGADSDTALVVFDDVPIMDQKRVEALSSLIDELLEDGREVIVACCPTADAYGLTQKDRVLLTSRDLLLDASEVAALGLAEALHADIPCMAWGSMGATGLLKGCSKEAMPADLKCAMMRLLVLGSGGLDDVLGIFDEARAAEIYQIFARYYTFLGVNIEEGRFAAIAVSVDDIKGSFLSSLDEAFGCTPFASADRLGMDLADALMGTAQLERAHEVLWAYVSHDERLGWLDKHGWEMICRGRPLSVVKLMSDDRKRRRLSPERRLLLAWAMWALCCEKEARAHCRKIYGSSTDVRMQAGALALLAHLSADPLDPSETLAYAEALSHLEAEAKHRGLGSSEELDWLALGRLMLPLSLGDVIEDDAWEDLARGAFQSVGTAMQMRLAALLIGCAWTVLGHGDGTIEDASARASAPLMEAMAGFVQRCIEASMADEGVAEMLALPFMVIADAFEKRGMSLEQMCPAFSSQASVRISQTRMDLEEQAHLMTKQREERAQGRARFDRTHPDPYRKRRGHPVMTTSSVPQLEVRMFGGLEVRIDGEMLDPNLFSRKRTRTLAAALALNKGHELTRERICEIVWPESEPELCVNSFYSVWASLKRALTYEGNCPYLVRSQVGCSLDARYLMTDMEEFEALCNALVFGGAQIGSWEELYAKVSGTFADSLLPGEADNPYISGIQERCRSRLVDGLLAVSRRLIGLAERTGALWFAREALRWDDGREDVYIALMEAQIAADQRGPALDTYFKCRKFLSEGLGIDPSPRLVQLYRSIIEYEERI